MPRPSKTLQTSPINTVGAPCFGFGRHEHELTIAIYRDFGVAKTHYQRPQNEQLGATWPAQNWLLAQKHTHCKERRETFILALLGNAKDYETMFHMVKKNQRCTILL